MLPGWEANGRLATPPIAIADDGEQDGVRYRQALGERQQQADQPEQGGDGKDGLDGIGHDGRLGRAYSSSG